MTQRALERKEDEKDADGQEKRPAKEKKGRLPRGWTVGYLEHVAKQRMRRGGATQGPLGFEGSVGGSQNELDVSI